MTAEITLPALDVRLEKMEISYSEYIANARLADVERHRRKNVADLVIGDSERGNHMLGALGEHAFAKWLGVERRLDGKWGLCTICKCFAGTVNTFKRGGDVGRYQVRTRGFDSAPLIVREDDRDEDVFVLVIPILVSRVRPDLPAVSVGIAESVDHFRIVGWTTGEAAKMFRLKQDPRGRGVAYFVPQNELRPMLTLPRDKEADDGRAGNTNEGTDAEPRAADAEQVRRERGAPVAGEIPPDQDALAESGEGERG